MRFSKRLFGLLSMRLLSMPSEGRVGQGPLHAILALCTIAVLASVMFGIVQWRLASDMGRTLNDLISGSLQILAVSQRMTEAMGDAHRFSLSTFLARTPSDQATILKRRVESLKKYDTLLAELRGFDPAEAKILSDLFRRYNEKSDIMCRMIQNHDIVNAMDFRGKELRPCFEEWQQAQTDLGAEILLRAETKKHHVEETFKNATSLLLAAILLPVVLGTACLLVVIFLLIIQVVKTSRPNLSDDAWGSC